MSLHGRAVSGYRADRTKPVTADMENLNRSIRNLIVPSKMILEQTSSEDLRPIDDDDAFDRDGEEPDTAHTAAGVNMRRLRKTVITRFSTDKVHHLKLFISKPVLRKIEDGQPLEYLSEMRQVTMLFINLELDRSTQYGYLLLMQRCYEVIYANAKRTRGCISKIFAFDKGCTFMVIFGLPGFKHENDSAHALGCAYAIYTELNAIVGLKQTSIGVTTGATYCGIVGHNHRHEYTVIGRRVNMGARLMMHYRGKVICDNTTFYYSKLNETFFIVQEAKEMKGLQQVGTVREYRPHLNLKNAMDQIRAQQEHKPIIGRDDELAQFEVCLEHVLAADTETRSHRTPIVMILGEVGMGRTRLLNAFIALALRHSITVVLCTLAIGNVTSSYYVTKTLLAQLIKCDGVAKEARVKLLADTFAENKAILKELSLLDQLLEWDVESESAREPPSVDKVMAVVRLVVRHFAERSTALIFAVDDTQLMDEFSWKCMPLFAENGNTMLLLTQRVLLDQHIKNETAINFIKDAKNMIVYCSGLSVFHLASIACQFLNVARIPDSLDHVLRLNSMGIPSWIDLLLREYLYESVIMIEWTLIVNHTETMVVPAPKDLVERKSDALQEQMYAERNHGSPTTNFVDELCFDTVSPNAELVCHMLIQQTDDLKVPTSIASMIQARIDHMQELDQTVLKSASIIGQFVFREILDHMLQAEVSRVDLGDAIQRLADSGAFACASSMKKSRGRAGVAGLGGAFSGQKCTCYGHNDEKPMSDCRVLLFLSASLRLTAYEMMLEQNRRPLHMSAAHFLEEKIRRLSVGSKIMDESSLYESYLDNEDDEAKSDGSATAVLPIVRESEEVDGEQVEEKFSPDMPSMRDRRWSRRSGSRRESRRVMPSGNVKAHAQRLKTIIGGEYSRYQGAGSIAVSDFVNKHFRNEKSRSLVASFDHGNVAAITADLAKLSGSMVVNYSGYERLGVLRIQYPQIAEQYRGAGNTQNTVFYLTEAAAACLAVFDHQGAITHLREVNRIIRDLKRQRNPFEGRVANLDNWKPDQLDEGTMESLFGQTLFAMERPKKAVPHFRRALKLFGCEQKTSPLQMRVATSMDIWRHQKTAIDERASPWEARILGDQAQCLFYLFEDCVSRDDLVGARYCAVQQFTKTELAGDVLGQIEAATCLLKLAHLTDDTAGIQEHETKAKVKCIVAMQNVRNDQVVRLTRVYWTAFEVHLARDPLTDAVESGLAASRMMMAVRGSGVVQVQMMAALVNALLYADRVKDAVDALDILHCDVGRTDSRCWYFCGCIHMVLTMGVRLALMEDCISYSEEILSQRMFVKRPQLMFSLACSLALYYRRVRSEDRFEEWRKVAAKYEPTRYDGFLAAVGFLDLLECKLLQLSRVIGEMRRTVALRGNRGRRHSVLSMNEAERRYLDRVVTSDIAFIEKVVRRLVVLEPRLTVLQAYFAGIRDRMNNARSLLQQATRRAEALSNGIHARWAKHNLQVWFGERVSVQGAAAAIPAAAAAAPTGEEEDTVGVARLRRGTISGSMSDAQYRRMSHRSSTISTGSRFGSIVPPMSAASPDPTDPSRPRRSWRRRSTAVSSWLQERGLSQSVAMTSTADLRKPSADDQWLKSAEASFPYWYILNHIRSETRTLLLFSLPLPHWFAARLF